MERVRLLNSRPHSELRVAPNEHQEAGAPALMHDAQGYVARDGQGRPVLDYQPAGDKIVEPINARACRGIVGDGQKHLRTATLRTEYTYVSLEMGYLHIPTATSDSYMKTYWRHHCTIAYLAATDRRWKEIMSAKRAEAATNFMKYSKGGTMIDEHHWISGPRTCVYYRQIKSSTRT